MSNDAGVPFASHIPLRYVTQASEAAEQSNGELRGVLQGHVARANPQWRHFREDQELLAIFHGPHHYISPTWYVHSPAVPTWNYAAVHVYGRPRIVDDAAAIRGLLQELVRTYEQKQESPWNGEIPDDYRDRMISAIVAFEIEITRVEAKFKLGQNREADDVSSVLKKLLSLESDEARGWQA